MTDTSGYITMQQQTVVEITDELVDELEWLCLEPGDARIVLAALVAKGYVIVEPARVIDPVEDGDDLIKVENVYCGVHEPIQHRDGKEKWCKSCGLNAEMQTPRLNHLRSVE